MALSTDFKDDILNESVNKNRKYQMIHNDDGTVSFVDVTSYSQTGSEYGAAEVNEERHAINELNSALMYYNANNGNEGEAFENNFLLITTTDKYGSRNESYYFTMSNAETWTNIPPTMPTTGIVIGLREVLWKSSSYICIRITEFWPTAGKQYYNFYNAGSWRGWKTITPQ